MDVCAWGQLAVVVVLFEVMLLARDRAMGATWR